MSGNTNAEEPQSGLFFLGVFIVVLLAIIVSIVYFIEHVHQF